MNKKVISKALIGIMLAGSIFVSNRADTQAEAFCKNFEAVPESVMIEHMMSKTNSGAGALPSSVDISTSKYFPTIQNQGSKLESCTAFATIYYQFSYEANKLNDINSKDLNNCYSPKWAYNSLNCGMLQGISINKAYDFLMEYGSLRWGDFPYDSGEDDENWEKAYKDLPGKAYADKMREALNCRLTKWNSCRIQGTGTAITNNKDADLDIVKTLLLQGHPLVVQTDCDWEVKNSPTYGYVVVSCASNDLGHTMTVVGYNDDVWYDANGNGRKDTGECGAFKVANSWGSSAGKSNKGYIWVLYDALNKESSIPGYKREDGKSRVPMFARGTLHNYFTSIEVENKSVQFVAEVNFYADNLTQLELSYGKDEKNTTYCSKRYKFGKYIYNQPSSYDGIALIDMDNAMDSIVTDYRGFRWYLYVFDSTRDSMYIRNISYKITDNLGKVIGSGATVSSLNGDGRALTTDIDLLIGDVNYSAAVDSDDAVLVLQYFARMREFSNVQMFLGDCNGDGKVNSDDAQLILSSFAGM